MTQHDNDSALVLFSGGQDSTVCLAWALTRYAVVETVGFSYGQRHEAELKARASGRSRRSPAIFRTGAQSGARITPSICRPSARSARPR